MITVSPYQESWPKRFQEEKERLEAAFNGLLIRFHHIGSTSVPGCAAKPIIDILGVTPDVLLIERFNHALKELGYAVLGEYGMKQRRFFRKEGEVHLHIFEDSDPEVCRHLRFCRYLQTHPQSAEQYSELKAGLARRYPEDIKSYILGKEAWVKQIDTLAVSERLSPLSYPSMGPRKAKWTVDEVMQAMHVNMHLHMTYFTKYHPGLHLVFQPDVTVVQADLQEDMVNYVLAANFTEENCSKRVAEILALYQEKPLPFSWWVSEARDTPSQLAAALQQQGLARKEVDAGMYRELEEYVPPEFNGTIRRVEISEMVKAYTDVIVSVGGHPDLYEKIYKQIPLPLIQEGAPFELYILYLDEKPVTSGLVVFHAQVAGIYFIATDPGHRRRGLGTQMMHYLMKRAQAKGYSIAVLQASEAGKSLYERLGFTQICRFVEYA